MEYLQHPFTIGLGVGLLGAVIVWVNAWRKRRALVQENRTLKEHLHTQMEITARGSSNTQKELADLRQQNENLRITNAALQQKPGRAELQTLAVYDKALHLMFERAPGFSGAWEGAVKEAEATVQKTEKGLLPLLRKAFRPSLGTGESQPRTLP